MKKIYKVLLVNTFCWITSTAVFAVGPTPIPQEIPRIQQDIMLSCDTVTAKHVLVLREPRTDTFTILYGSDLKQPERITIKQGNDMGTEVHQSLAEGTYSREIFASANKVFITVGYLDKAGVTSAYYQVQEGITKLVTDKCKPETLVSKFDSYENFVNLTEVD